MRIKHYVEYNCSEQTCSLSNLNQLHKSFLTTLLFAFTLLFIQLFFFSPDLSYAQGSSGNASDYVHITNNAGSGTTTNSSFGFGVPGSGNPNDIDNDGVLNANDNCPNYKNPNQTNQDGDTYGDACDLDIDGDNIINDNDNCVYQPNFTQGD